MGAVGCHNLIHQAPGELSAGFAKLRKPGAWSKGKGWWLELAQLALFLHPTSQPGPPPAYLSALVMEIRGGISSGRVVGRGGRGTPGSKGSGSAQPRPGPVERRRRGRRRSAPSMLARPGSGVVVSLCVCPTSQSSGVAALFIGSSQSGEETHPFWADLGNFPHAP